MSARQASLVAIVVVATIALGIPSAGAEPGDLDATFGTCGVKLSPILGLPTSSMLGATVGQPDGKILQVIANADDTIGVTRFTPSGTNVDPTYGTFGFAKIAVPGLSTVRAAVLGSNGKLVVLAPGPSDTRLVRLNASGSPDQGFGTGGVLALDRFPPEGILVQADNRIILWGGFAGVLERYNPNGSLNSAWTPAIPSGEGNVVAAALAPNGDFVAAVGSEPTHVHRFLPDGTEDGTFSASYSFPAPGTATDVGYDAQQVIPLADGSVLVAGRLMYSDPPGSIHQFVTVTKLDSTGQPDAAYGTAGFASRSVTGHPTLTAARLDAAGRLLVSGKLGADEAPFVLARFTTTGTPDPAFGTGGSVQVNAGFFPAVTGLILRDRWIIVGLAVQQDFGQNYSAFVRFRSDNTKLGAGYTVDSAGGFFPFRFGSDSPPPCVTDGPGAQLFGLVRGVTTVSNRGGLVLDAFGGLHRFSVGVRKAPAPAQGGPYWSGFDIARGVAALPNGKGGYVLDGYGGIHPYRTGSNPMPAAATGGPYWQGWDIARGIALLPNGSGGYVLDAFGVPHPFATGGNPMPPPTTIPLYAPGQDVARGIAILADGTGGHIGHVSGALFPFGIASNAPPPPAQAGLPHRQPSDIRGVTFVAPRVGSG